MGVFEKEDNGPMQIVDVEQEFTSFVQNYEQNRIMLGIPYLDNLKICPTKKELFTMLMPKLVTYN